MGPNGAGKSTLMKILSGILKNFDGDIMVSDGLSSRFLRVGT
ncbi:ATP-binding cassette domain-containing protein [Mangrovibacillus sp. Mu-81]